MTAIRQVKKFAITLSAQLFKNTSKSSSIATKQLPVNNQAAMEGSVRFVKKTVKKSDKQALSEYTIF